MQYLGSQTVDKDLSTKDKDLNPDSATAAMTQPVGVDENRKLWTAPGGGVASTHIETILDYTFAADYTLSEAPNFSDYILYNGSKAVWNKDKNGNPMKAKRVWGFITLTQTVDNSGGNYTRSAFTLTACAWKGHYQSTPSTWEYGDDAGNGVGTAQLNVQSILNATSLANQRSSYGCFDRDTMSGWFVNVVGELHFGGAMQSNVSGKQYNRMADPNDAGYFDHIYAIMLNDNQPTRKVPAGVRIRVVAEVYDS